MASCLPPHGIERDSGGHEENGEQSHGDGVTRVVSQESGGERNCTEQQEQQVVQPEQCPICPAHEMEEAVVVDPEDGYEQEAQQETRNLGGKGNQRMPRLGRTRRIVELRGLDLQYQEGNDDGEDAVAKRLDATDSKCQTSLIRHVR